MYKYLFSILVLALSLPVLAQEQGDRPDHREAMEDKIESHKVAFLTSELDLTPEESREFWPIYNSYQAKFRELRPDMPHRGRGKDISEEQAEEMIRNFFDFETRELEMKKQLYSELRNVLPPTKLVRLHIAEKEFRLRLLERLKKDREEKRPRR